MLNSTINNPLTEFNAQPISLWLQVNRPYGICFSQIFAFLRPVHSLSRGSYWQALYVQPIYSRTHKIVNSTPTDRLSILHQYIFLAHLCVLRLSALSFGQAQVVLFTIAHQFQFQINTISQLIVWSLCRVRLTRTTATHKWTKGNTCNGYRK